MPKGEGGDGQCIDWRGKDDRESRNTRGQIVADRQTGKGTEVKASRQFLLGALVGLSAGSILRRQSAGGFRQADIGRVYRAWAPVYTLANVYLLGQLPRFRQLAVEKLRLEPGASVLDLSCGTGANFPLLEEQIGPEGRLVGLDYTSAMLVQARRQVEEQGWENVELVEADAASFALDEQFDAALWTLAASVVPGWQLAMERAAAHLKPGGYLVIADGRLSDRWYALPFNWIADLMGVPAAADLARRPWQLMPRYLERTACEELLMGFLYVAWGQRATK
jgi:ubiquinone/menaquinone biosynthesis C-methylase UbiE